MEATEKPEREIVVVGGEMEVWAYVPDRHDFIAADGQTPQSAAQVLMNEHPEYFKDHEVKILTSDGTLPPDVSCKGRYRDKHGNPADS